MPQAMRYHCPMELRAEIHVDYEDLGLIGVGAVGEVRRVRDRRLQRVMAMKILRPEWSDDAQAAARFVEEAQATAQLQHPGIVPVHEIGRLSDQRLYFTMKEVQGRTLAEVIETVHAQAGGNFSAVLDDGWSFRRLIEVFRAVCEAVAYAHSRVVIHRDIKPQNIMVGAFGEVLVLDWGLAMVVGLRAGDNAVTTQRSEDDALATSLGTISGTPAYMAPEQARGEQDRINARSDVYSLGAVLYQILTGQPPYTGADAYEVLRKVIAGAPQAFAPVASNIPATLVDVRAPGPSILTVSHAAQPVRLNKLLVPPELWAACERAMAREAEARFADAAELSAAIIAWLEGAKRRENALARVAQAQALLPALATLEAHANELAEQAHAQLAQIKPWRPAEEKQAAWALEDLARTEFARADAEHSRIIQLLQTALVDAPELSEAHAAIANLYRKRHEQAERAGDAVSATRFESLLQLHDRGEHARWLNGDGAVSLVTEPAGAVVHLLRYQSRGRRRVAEAVGILGTTPLHQVRLPHGDWLLRLEHPNCQAVHYPVSITRLEHWDGIAPGEHAPRAIWLPPTGALKADQIYVPSGWYQRGGDAAASGAGPRERAWVEGFLVNRWPATNAEYQAFLTKLMHRQHGVLAEVYAPREQRDGAVVGRADACQWHLPAHYLPRAPIVNIDWFGAEAFAHAHGARLLSEDEWEKAARGVDGRLFPWGDGFDASFCRMRDSAEGLSSLVAVDEYESDESPYGVRGLAGNACTWCAGTSQERRPYRGGAWAFHEISVRSACRYATDPGYRYFGLGVRLGADVPTTFPV